jgi:PhoPQ-activated pathogenicity-related protein
MHRLPTRWAHALLLLACVSFLGAAPGEEKTALDEYCAKPDDVYGYKLVDTIPGDGFKTFVLEMTSQTYLTTEEVDHTVWRHWMVMTVPDEVKTNVGLLFISGGSIDSSAPDKVDPLTSNLAKGSGSVVTELKGVPNQAVTFKGETRKRSEDSLIAYTWDKFLRTGDPKWPARLPMTKSAVRALDTITAFCGSEEGGKKSVDKFVVCGGSKRGWTTWTTAAVDKRVIGISPMVIDMLNIEPSFQHHWKAYGFWAPAVGDYTAEKIMDWNGTPQYKALMKIEEPFEYRSRLTMPKYVINATGDQFFLPDSSQFYWDELPGPKYLRYVPNAEHSLKGTDVPFTLLSFYNAVKNGSKLPEYSWKVNEDNSMRVVTDIKPTAVKLWQATNPKTRDFRVDRIGRVWKSQPLEAAADGSYSGNVEKPAEGYTAYLIEMTYDNPGSPPIKFTTQVKVVPDVLPFEYKQPTPPIEQAAASAGGN